MNISTLAAPMIGRPAYAHMDKRMGMDPNHTRKSSCWSWKAQPLAHHWWRFFNHPSWTVRFSTRRFSILQFTQETTL